MPRCFLPKKNRARADKREWSISDGSEGTLSCNQSKLGSIQAAQLTRVYSVTLEEKESIKLRKPYRSDYPEKGLAVSGVNWKSKESEVNPTKKVYKESGNSIVENHNHETYSRVDPKNQDNSNHESYFRVDQENQDNSNHESYYRVDQENQENHESYSRVDLKQFSLPPSPDSGFSNPSSPGSDDQTYPEKRVEVQFLQVAQQQSRIPGLHNRSKEETEAAHDLLQLSRSLPPLPSPTTPTPPPHYLDQGYTTLIYITPETPGDHYIPLPLPSLKQGESSTFSTLNPPPFSSYTQNTTQRIDSSLQENKLQIADGTLQIADNTLQLADEKLQIEDGKLPISDGRTRRNSEVQSGKQKYSCTECGKDYATSSNLSRHKQTHRSLDSGSAKQCHICHKLYVSMPALSMHILTHTLNHRCDVCGKAFSRPWLLQGHRRSHTGDKPYSCALCVKSFADRSNLRAHMQTHSPAKNFKCERCDKMFALKSYLNKHQESVCSKPGVFL